MTRLTDWLGPMDRTVHRAGDTQAVRLRRRYDTTPDDVWSAWTEAGRLRRWLGEVTGDLREGGEIVLDMGDDESATCRILRCDRPHRLVVTWTFPGEADSVAELRLSADGDGTLLELAHVGLDRTELARDYGEGWEDFLHRLGQHLDGAEPSDISWADVRATLDPFWVPLVNAPVTDDRWPTAKISGEHADLTVRRTFAASSERVWSALTEPAELAAWFGAVEAGETWTVSFADGPGTAEVRVERCEPPKELVVTWRWDHAEAPSVVRLTLEPVDGGTMLSIEETGAAARYARGYGAGWYAKLAGLAIHLSGDRPTEADWDADFALAARSLAAR